MRAFSLIGECAEKSELVHRLVAELVGRGLRVSAIKRVSDAVDLEREGSGTWKHRQAGAEEVMIASTTRFALLRELSSDTAEPDVAWLLTRMTPVDVILLDGFRRSNMPKMEVISADQEAPRYLGADPMVVAIASDRSIESTVPRLALSRIDELADFVLAHAAFVENGRRLS